MARLPYFDLAQATPGIQELLKERPPLNIYRMVAHGAATGEGAVNSDTFVEAVVVLEGYCYIVLACCDLTYEGEPGRI